jgi:ELWxxDGT repeat protein
MGTVLVKNLAPGALASDPQHLVAFAEGVLFSATDSTTLANGAAQGRELYRSNGTAAGTTLVKDINETLESSSNPEG